LAVIFEDGFEMKKYERMNPWIIPIKINTDMASIWVEVFINQI